MPFVLKNRSTSEIYACTMLNNYQIPYYGIKSWAWKDEAEGEIASFLNSQGVEEIEGWEILEIEDNKLKIFNVKLKNDSQRKLYLDEDGNPVIQTVS
jgi:hypothetical protein